MLLRNTAGVIEASMVVISTGAGLTAGTVYAYVRRQSDDKWLYADTTWNASKPTTTDIPTMTHVSGGLWELDHTPADAEDVYLVNCIDSGATCYPDNYQLSVLSQAALEATAQSILTESQSHPTLAEQLAGGVAKEASVQLLLAGDVGTGDTAVNHDTGGTDNLRAVDGSGDGIDNLTIKAYLKTNYDAGNRAESYVEATSTTDASGRWARDIYLDSGFTYTIVFYRQGAYNVTTKEITI